VIAAARITVGTEDLAPIPTVFAADADVPNAFLRRR
jgi:hypothetical protein